MDEDSPHGWTDAVRRQEDEGDSHGEAPLNGSGHPSRDID